MKNRVLCASAILVKPPVPSQAVMAKLEVPAKTAREIRVWISDEVESLGLEK